jgi:hypothetical protein
VESLLINRRLETYYLTILVVFLISAGHVSAQDNRCKSKLNDLPAAAELKGFRLGMTMDQVKARVPQVAFGPTDPLGMSKTSIHPFFDPRIDKSTFEGVRTVSLDFLDGRLASLWIGYDSSAKWPTVDDFVREISQSLLLHDAWAPWKSRGQQLRCADFEMTATMVAGGPSFRIQDQTAEEAWIARREAQAEQESAQGENSPEEEPILGDKQTKIYYPGECQPAKGISEANRVVFKTREEAEKTGFRPAKNCL